MDEKKKKNIRNTLFAVAVVLAVVLLTALPFLLNARQESRKNRASILSTTVDRGVIEKTISGAGTLTEQDAAEIEVPQGVRVTDYLVQNGQFVNAGDALATVDRVSVMQTVSTVYEAMSDVRTEMETLRSGSDYTYVSTPASGRVKAVYAQAGDQVQDVILQHGALAVLSLDGRMAVRFRAEQSASLAQAVTVVLPDGTEAVGKVETVIDGEATVTFPDQYGRIGETAEVRDESGRVLGSGAIFVHSAWKAMATEGTVTNVYVAEDRTVSVNGTLFVLNDSSVGGDYEKLAALHREYEDIMASLFQMRQDGVLKAPCSGLVSGVDDSILKSLAYETGEKPVLRLLANAPGDDPDAQMTNVIGIVTDTAGTAWLQTWATEIEDYSDTAFLVTAVESFTRKTAFSPAPAYQWTAKEIQKDVYTEVVIDAFDDGTTYYVRSNTTESGYEEVDRDAVPAPEENTTYYTRATVTVDGGEWVQTGIAVGGIYAFCFDGSDNLVWMIYVGHSDTLPKDQEKPSGSGTGGMPSGGGEMPSGGGGGGMSSGGGGGTGAMGGSASSAEEDERYPTAGTVILSITPQETVTVPITVDELDILSVHVGQTVQVTLDALIGQAFTGTITEVNTTASNEGGNSKYTATVSMNRTRQMLGGMNASANITVEKREGILVLPAEALTDLDGQTVVYTAWDSREETLTDPVPVETGLSDGLQVEITSGLQEGDTVWYSYYDTLEIQGLPS